MTQDAAQIKERILYLLRIRGPSLPVHVSKEIKADIIFSSAFLSELVSDKKIKVSNMRVGSSPIYFLSGQEQSLEKFSEYLKSKEKEVFLLLKEKRFLIDSEQLPAVRVAIREIKDFAIPFKRGEELVWRYFLASESEFNMPLPLLVPSAQPERKIMVIRPAEKVINLAEKAEKDDRQEKKEEKREVEEKKEERKERKKPGKRKKAAAKKDDGFFSVVKDFISSKSIELIDIENFGSKEIVLKVRDNGEDKLLVAYNKNKIADADVIKAAKRAEASGLKYVIIGKGGPLKKLENLISAVKGLSFIEKIK